ncbi:MAG TPA: C4-type zinc ribbon domain-containing protein [Nocardioidaceae bacterium]|nr:C4-type zinc ribbon domain-containing protein [Nocardioidaceae bacterium]
MQTVDSSLQQLAHRKKNLPQHAELAEVTKRRSALDSRLVELDTQIADLTREQKKADVDVEQVKSRRVRDQQRLDTGQVSSPRELEQLQSEIVALDRRIGVLEDAELEIMEQLETFQGELTEVASELEDLNGKATQIESARDEAVGELDREAADATAERTRLAADVPEQLLAVYERMRAQLGGVGAAALRRRRCEGCRLELTEADFAAIRSAPDDEVLRCPECNRILVRTPDSGL